ncbi:thiol-disulfide oxidoreductase DCC family protein [Paenibacillus tritici]|uniref:thiol-disulfide oxidoreductase DCC family protein n=1 Tax=Paenibacillus tritici TaxID=1873425 RepID=UPI001BAC63AF|nr:thiol-disulfide oxidoreductase DCC family protein [Paenibacillus tritici]QUL56085.1 thiol-disulfide oxidoreductase DCC family protein [Paenibacillus tritici]
MAETNKEVQREAVVLIDGVCHLCQGLVRFIIPRDPQANFKFASLQSEAGRELLKAGGLPERQLDTVVLVENGKYYTESAAVLRIARRLRFPWPLAYVFTLIPRPLRNAIYRIVARNRYRWFGRDEQCLLPTPDMKRRFL